MTSTDSDSDRTPGQRRTVEWPRPESFYLTLDLECDFGTALSENTYQAVEAVDQLVALLEERDTPLTCFVQTELLDAKPGVVENLRNCGVDVRFHPHSHTHRRREQAAVDAELQRSTDRYRAFFGGEPVGYRFPNGNVREADYRLLADHGYEFDASIFPSWRPNHFDNTGAPTLPQYLAEYDLFEIPFTVYSDRLRIPTALSYNRLLRRPFDWLLTRRPPPVVIYNIHMHDLVTPESYDELPALYKLVYGTNDRGFELLAQVLDAFFAAGYSFGTIDEVHKQLRAGVSTAEPAAGHFP